MNLLGSTFSMALWLLVLVVSSFILSHGAESLAHKLGARLVGRTLLSVTTTLPEIVLVASASSLGFYGTALGSALGSNVLMMSLGLAIMVLIATTRLSKKPAKWVGVEGFRIDTLFLAITAVAGTILFWDGYGLVDGFLFIAFFAAYTLFSFHEAKKPEHKILLGNHQTGLENPIEESHYSKSSPKVARALLYFIVGGVGIFIAAEPFVQSLELIAEELVLPSIVIAVVISPIAGEMPEKLSVMLLARQGKVGVDMAIANVLGSKILNNSLLLGIMVLAASLAFGTGTAISPESLFTFQVYWTAVITFLALFLTLDKRLTRKEGVILLVIYFGSLILQFMLSSLLGM